MFALFGVSLSQRVRVRVCERYTFYRIVYTYDRQAAQWQRTLEIQHTCADNGIETGEKKRE